MNSVKVRTPLMFILLSFIVLSSCVLWPQFVSITPSVVKQGDQNVTVQIICSNTQFEPGSMEISLVPPNGITILEFT